MHHAYQHSILGLHERARPWIFQNHIQLLFDKSNLEYPIQFYLPDNYGNNFSVISPMFDIEILSKNTLERNCLDFNKVMIQAINDGNYVVAYVNEKYVPNTKSEGLKDYCHMTMFSGYIKETDSFIFSGFNKNGNFSERLILGDELRKAYIDNKISAPRIEDKIILLKVRNDNDSDLKFDDTLLLEDLTTYLESKVPGKSILDSRRNKNYIYGMQIYANLAELLTLYSTKAIRFKLTPIHIVMEHKLMMVERLKYLQNIKPHLNLEIYMNGYDHLKTKLLIIRTKMVKFRIKDELLKITELIPEINSIHAAESELLTHLVKTLKTEL